MKKTPVVFLCAVLFFLSGCTSSGKYGRVAKKKKAVVVPEFSITIEGEDDIDWLDISVTPNWGKRMFVSGYDWFNFSFTNKTDQPLKIVWRDSAMHYRRFNHKILVEGTRYERKDYPADPSKVEAGETLTKKLMSVDQPFKQRARDRDVWIIDKITDTVVQFFLCVQSQDDEMFYTVTVQKIPDASDRELIKVGVDDETTRALQLTTDSRPATTDAIMEAGRAASESSQEDE